MGRMGGGWLHERCVLGFLGDVLAIVPPHWDMYIERMSEYECLYRPGPRGGLPAVYREDRTKVVRFDRAMLERKLPRLILAAAEKLGQYRVEHNLPLHDGDGPVLPVQDVDRIPVDGTVTPAGQQVAGRGVGTWIAIDDRAGLIVGQPILASCPIVVVGNLVICTRNGVQVGAAILDSWSPPALASGVADDLRTFCSSLRCSLCSQPCM